jgi:hypothetical protein
MFKTEAVAALIVVAALAACSDANTDSVAPRQVTVSNPFQDKLLALKDVDRNLALRRGIQDDEGQCARITAAAYQQDYRGMAMWVADCSDRDWAVYIAPSGAVQARACDEARQLGLPECRPIPVAASPEAPVKDPSDSAPAP